jgi:hypothetical protein
MTHNFGPNTDHYKMRYSYYPVIDGRP